MAAGSRPPVWTPVIHLRTDELLIELHTLSDGQAASPVKEGTKHAQYLSCLLSNLVDVCQPRKLSIKGHTKVISRFESLYWLS
jgi:hypothetical protein